MATFQVSGSTTTMSSDSELVSTAVLTLEETINRITGAIGINVVRVTNTSVVDTAQIAFEPLTTVYTFNNVTGAASASGTDAAFNVIATYNVGYLYTITGIANIGSGYIEGETITIQGNELGGTGGGESANNLVLTVDTVDENGGVLTYTYTSGVSAWPMNPTYLFLSPTQTEFVQVTNAKTPAGVWFSNQAFDGEIFVGAVLVTPVAIVNN